MIDVVFYRKIHEFKKQIMAGEIKLSKEAIVEFLNGSRTDYPVVFNIETTNACNMTCSFCPRTTKMTRAIKTMSPDVFNRVADQIYPHDPEVWRDWVRFAADEYGVSPAEQSENAFFLYTLPRVVVLHGYGDPLLDTHIADRVARLSANNVSTYFSCNPHNINLARIANTFEAGQSYIKFSIDSLSNPARGLDSFAADYPLIMQVLDMKARSGYKTKIIITMIDLGHEKQQEEFASLKESFAGTDVYIYLKSLDQAWMIGTHAPGSIHWSEFCQIPWSSMTIKSDGMAASCQEDFNNEILLGDTRVDTLAEIWNSENYANLRRDHIFKKPGHRCWERCDMKPIGKFL